MEDKVLDSNELHPLLKFSHQCETKSSITYQDIMICRSEGGVTSIWHTKPTETVLTINYHSLTSQKYKRSVICGLAHKIHRASSTWKYFHESLVGQRRYRRITSTHPPLLSFTSRKLRES